MTIISVLNTSKLLNERHLYFTGGLIFLFVVLFVLMVVGFILGFILFIGAGQVGSAQTPEVNF